MVGGTPLPSPSWTTNRISLSNLIHEDATPLNRRQAAEVVSGAAASMARLIDDLLAVARQRSGAYTESELDLGTLARGAVEEYHALADQRSIRLVPRIEDPGPRVYGHGRPSPARCVADAGEVLVAVGSRRG